MRVPVDEPGDHEIATSVDDRGRRVCACDCAAGSDRDDDALAHGDATVRQDGSTSIHRHEDASEHEEVDRDG